MAPFFLNGYAKVSPYRDQMSGGLLWEYAETILIRNYGESDYTFALIDLLPEIEAIKNDWVERGRKK